MSEADLRIETVSVDDAGELLTLRRAAFVSEAQVQDDPHLPALTQTLDELVDDLQAEGVVTIGAWSGHRLVGSVRVELEEVRATLGLLAVAPDLQGQGIGTQLLLGILPHLPESVSEVWVYTGENKKQNVDLSMAADVGTDQTANDLTYAYLRKLLGEVDVSAV